MTLMTDLEQCLDHELMQISTDPFNSLELCQIQLSTDQLLVYEVKICMY